MAREGMRLQRYNRTYVELKLDIRLCTSSALSCYNRTYVELKL